MKLTCKEASRLISEGLDRDLPATQRTALRMHITICKACQRISAQFDFLRRAVGGYPDGNNKGGKEQ